MSWRRTALLLIILIGGALRAHAQREYEITPFFGSRFGGSIDVSQQATSSPNVDFLKIKPSENFGVMADVSFWGNFQGEFMWNRQPTSLTAHNPNDNSYTFLTNMNFDLYEADLVYQFKSSESKFRPFIVGGLGMAHFGGFQQINGQQAVGFSNRFTFNLGAGVKYYFTNHVGVRAELRWSPTDTTQGLSNYCDPVFGCSTVGVTNKAEQGQANIGLIFRF